MVARTLFWQSNHSVATTEEIGTFIDRKQQKITLDGFLLQNGLAGLGCMLLPTNQQTTLNHITNL